MGTSITVPEHVQERFTRKNARNGHTAAHASPQLPPLRQNSLVFTEKPARKKVLLQALTARGNPSNSGIVGGTPLIRVTRVSLVENKTDSVKESIVQ
jgi:hypothetical protein